MKQQNHSVYVTIGILDPIRPTPRISQPVTVHCWIAGLLLLIVGIIGLTGNIVREVSWQIGWLVRDGVELIDRAALVLGVWLGLPSPVMVWGVG